MESKKLIAILAVIIVVVAAAAAVVMLNSGSEKKTGGLYALDAQVISVDMGGITATPKMVASIEELYEQVYGDLVKTDFTIEDAKNDTKFWNEYCNYDPVVKDNQNGTFTVTISLSSGDRDITLNSTANSMLSMGTMYMTTVYYFLCEKYDVEPYSNNALNNSDLKKEFQSIVAGATSLSYVESNTELIDYFDKDTYKDCGQNTIANYDTEQMGQDTKDLSSAGKNVILVASGKSVSDSAYNTMRNTFQANGGMEPVLVTASSIKEAFANIECLGYILGFGEYTDDLIEDLQVRLYAVYYSLQQKSDEHKVYWETYAGKSISMRGMSESVLEFMGWNTSLINGGEVDTETLLQEKPDIIIFYTNDTRSMDDKMRA